MTCGGAGLGFAALLEESGCEVDDHDQQQQQTAPGQQTPAATGEAPQTGIGIVVTGEFGFAGFEEDALPAAEAIDGDGQFGGYALYGFSAQEPVNRRVFLGRAKVQRLPAIGHRNRIQRCISGADAGRRNGENRMAVSAGGAQ